MSRSGNTKQVIHWQDNYDTVFDNSIPFRKNDLLRITYFRIPGMPGLHFVCHCRTGTVTPVTVFHLSHGQCRGPAGSESESQPEAGGHDHGTGPPAAAAARRQLWTLTVCVCFYYCRTYASNALVTQISGTCCGMSLPQCLEKAACQLRSGEGCAQELQRVACNELATVPLVASLKPISKFTPGAHAPRVTASSGCEEKEDEKAWPFFGFHV